MCNYTMTKNQAKKEAIEYFNKWSDGGEILWKHENENNMYVVEIMRGESGLRRMEFKYEIEPRIPVRGEIVFVAETQDFIDNNNAILRISLGETIDCGDHYELKCTEYTSLDDIGKNEFESYRFWKTTGADIFTLISNAQLISRRDNGY